MAAAWPPAEVQEFAGWQFRHTMGITRRANSVLAASAPDDISGAVDAAEDFYRQRNLPTVFLVSEASTPVSVRQVLEDRGYVESATTWMLWSPTAEILDSLPTQDRLSVQVSAAPTDDWFDLYWKVESLRHGPHAADLMRRTLLNPKWPAVYVAAGDLEDMVSVGQVVIQNDWGCAQCLATAPAGRRRGAATQVIRRLAIEAGAGGASKIFVAVMASNTASLGLCERASMRRSHRYSYYAHEVD